MVCSINSPKLAKNEAVLLMATDTHRAPSTPIRHLAFHAKRSVGYSKLLAGAAGRKNSVISIADRTPIQQFRISGLKNICDQQTITAIM